MKKLLTALVLTLSTAALAEQANTQAQEQQKRNEGRRISTGVDAADVGPAINKTANNVSQKVTGGAKEAKKDVKEAAHETKKDVKEAAHDTKEAADHTAEKAKDKADKATH